MCMMYGACIGVCMDVYIYVGIHAHTWVSVCVSIVNTRCLLWLLATLFIEASSLIWTQISTSQLAQGISCLCFLSAGITGRGPHKPVFLMWDLGLHSGLQACTAITLVGEPAHQPPPLPDPFFSFDVFLVINRKYERRAVAASVRSLIFIVNPRRFRHLSDRVCLWKSLFGVL